MTDDDGEHTLRSVWRHQRQWSQMASSLKQSIITWRTVALILAIVGAVFATLATQVDVTAPRGRTFSIVAAVALAIAPTVRAARLGEGAVRAWTRARSVSEALKAEAYLYLTRSTPYNDTERDARLLSRAEAIMGQAEDVRSRAPAVSDDGGDVPSVSDVASYIQQRVRRQIDDYYVPQAAKQERRLRLFRAIEFTLSLTGAALGAVAAAGGFASVGAWVAVATTIGGAITAHIAAARYEHLVISYGSTARQLRFLVARWQAQREHSKADADAFVRECEDVISRENESWMAAWSRDEPTTPTAAAP